MKILLKCRRFEQITKGVPEMLLVAGDAVDPVYKFLKEWL
jgi:hypothetical protein